MSVEDTELVSSRLPWFTYRTGFSPIGFEKGQPITTDAGWGCMLRSGQMMTATALLKCWSLGEWWEGSPQLYKKILSLFNDHPSAPFSIHQIASTGVSLGKHIGSWFGPITISSVLKQISKQHEGELPFYIYNAIHSTINTTEISVICTGEPEGVLWRKPLFVLIPTRLGVETVNPVYLNTLKEYLQMPHSVGFIGGRPQFAYYFYAIQDDQLLYLDPHLRQQASYITTTEENDMTSYFSPSPKAMKLNGIDTSLALGFFIKDHADWLSFSSHLDQLQLKTGFSQLFSIERQKAVSCEHKLIELNMGEELSDGDGFELLGETTSPSVSLNPDGDDFEM
uniref:Cysteine protease n=1 Tax=Arcella intermedia TaxID=1963864 RepID=A0A6B2L8P9_9EUKA